MNLDNIETTTFHDRRPSHPAVPGAVLAARSKAIEAWFLRDLAFTNYQAKVGSWIAYQVLDEQAHRFQDELERLLESGNGKVVEGQGVA